MTFGLEEFPAANAERDEPVNTPMNEAFRQLEQHTARNEAYIDAKLGVEHITEEQRRENDADDAVASVYQLTPDDLNLHHDLDRADALKQLRKGNEKILDAYPGYHAPTLTGATKLNEEIQQTVDEVAAERAKYSIAVGKDAKTEGIVKPDGIIRANLPGHL